MWCGGKIDMPHSRPVVQYDLGEGASTSPVAPPTLWTAPDTVEPRVLGQVYARCV